MTERPEDYAPPKVRAEKAQETEMLRAVNNAVSEVEQVAQPENKVQDFAVLGAQAILKYAEASAMTCEQTGTEVMADAQRLREECVQLAEDIRHVARIQAQAVQRAMDRNREAAQGITALRKAFHADISKEQTEIEARKTRATS
jgi:hypothetical protein